MSAKNTLPTRRATHAGSWYTANPRVLGKELQSWLDSVPDQVSDILTEQPDQEQQYEAKDKLQTEENDKGDSHIHAIIVPHAGYTYCGRTAAYSYKALDISKYSRIILLGPSHHVYLDDCAISGCGSLETPFGKLAVDVDEIARLKRRARFSTLRVKQEEDEHSLEMLMPFLHYVFGAAKENTTHLKTNHPSDSSGNNVRDGAQSQGEHGTTLDSTNGLLTNKAYSSAAKSAAKNSSSYLLENKLKVIPIIVGNLDREAEAYYGKVLSEYLNDEDSSGGEPSRTLFAISSDFCHWGTRFQYTFYSPSETENPSSDFTFLDPRITSRDELVNYQKHLKTVPIHTSIKNLDYEAIAAIKSLDPAQFASYLDTTENTICGRHPIMVLLEAVAYTSTRKKSLPSTKDSSFRVDFVDYSQSSKCLSVKDSSVSYAAGILYKS
ncbi:Protein MEMO1 [Zancudomyces culisetae]|uniref:Protein MEMO1 n=1 Tax=Zancudomyces culisetae TaxID=1213189 RepID=A0A1R1PPD1_ZANCU|nr:Protein MEMO1 [Zancudomyces culisetae]OMH83479.1 Protein MEMO1 [Zancudomyces culisetae]|eukprot:OMH82801.1 Protein MEMO1 [Zancudomyces culisetae]